MSSQTVSTDMNMVDVIALGMVDGDSLTITNGATVTVTESPTILIDTLTVTEGVFHIDGLNISSGNMIGVYGEYGKSVSVSGQGNFKVTGDWYNLGTTDGTDNQVFSLSTFLGSQIEDAVNGIWVETGRRIYFDNTSGTLPGVYDWVEKTSDKTVRGQILEVNEANSYLVVRCLFGTLVDNDDIRVITLVDDYGPMLEVTWEAKVNHASGTIKEDGVYQPFGNCVYNKVEYKSSFGTGLGGLVFSHIVGDGYITLGGASGGFVPPSGCNVRIPNVNIGTSDTTNFSGGTGSVYVGTSTEVYRWEPSSEKYGYFDLDKCNLGSVFFATYGVAKFNANFVAGNIGFGGSRNLQKVTCSNNIMAVDPHTGQSSNYVFRYYDSIPGFTLSDNLVIYTAMTTDIFGTAKAFDVSIERNIIIYGDRSANNAECFTILNTSDILLDKNIVISNKLGTYWPSFCDIRNCNNVTITNSYVSAANDAISVDIATYFMKLTESRNVTIKGVREVINSVPAMGLVSFDSCSDIKIRAIGLPEDVFPRTSDPASTMFSYYGVNSDIDIARVFQTRTVTSGEESIISEWVTQKNITYSNVCGNYNSPVATVGIDTTQFKGFSAGDYTYLGSSYGITSTLPGTSGYQIHDFFRSATQGLIVCTMVPPTDNANKVTVVAGDPKFFLDGDLDMHSGDIIEFEQNYFALGHTGFDGDYTTVNSYAAYGSHAWSNVDIYFQYDTGSGWNGTWLDISVSSNLTSVSIPSTGIKIKLRFEASGTQASMGIMALHTTSTTTAQETNLYQIDQVECDVILSNIAVGSRYSIYDSSDDSLMATGVAASTSVTETLTTPSGTNIDIKVRKGTTGARYEVFNTATITNDSEVVVYISQVEAPIG